MAGIDNWQSERRYRTLEDFLKQKGGCMDYLSAAELLSGKTEKGILPDAATKKISVFLS